MPHLSFDQQENSPYGAMPDLSNGDYLENPPNLPPRLPNTSNYAQVPQNLQQSSQLIQRNPSLTRAMSINPNIYNQQVPKMHQYTTYSPARCGEFIGVPLNNITGTTFAYLTLILAFIVVFILIILIATADVFDKRNPYEKAFFILLFTCISSGLILGGMRVFTKFVKPKYY